jgi:excisionase family DNA binding protein
MSYAGVNVDILRGSQAIADYLGVSNRFIQEVCKDGRFPHFRLGRGGMICARKSTILAWIADSERRTAAGQN